MTFVYIAVVLVAVYFIFRSSQGSEPVEVEAAVLGTDGQIDAIEYFWRPG